MVKWTSNLPDDLREERQKKKEKEGTDIFLYCTQCDQFELHKFKKKLRKKFCKICDTELIHRPDTVYTQKDDSSKRRKWAKYAHEGMDKEQAHQFYQTSIEGSKRRIEGTGGASHYKAVEPDMDYMVKNGFAKPIQGEDAKNLKSARKEVVVKHVGNRKNFNPGRSNSSQSSK